MPLGSGRRRTPAGQPLRSSGRPGPTVDARAPAWAVGLSSYLEARTIRKTWLRCRGSTSSRSRGAGSGQVPPRRRARRLPELRWPALLSPRRPSPPRGAAGAASGARIARAGLRAAVAAPLAGSLGRGAASPELAAETEGTTGEASIQKVQPLRLTSHSRHHVTAAELGWGWRAGKAGTVFHVPAPLLSPPAPAPAPP